LVMPWHRVLDAHLGGRIGTTARGIGPCYEDRAGRRGLRLGDLVEEGRVDRDHFARRVGEVLEEKNRILQRVYGLEPLEAEPIVESYSRAAEVFASQVGDTSELLFRLKAQGRVILYEGAQGALLDVDWGTYPFVTSSSVSLGGCCVGTGIDPEPELRLGVVKAYATRVGEGPFPTELGDYALVKERDRAPLSPLSDEERRRALEGDDYLMGRWLRAAGAEFGTTTGRPRRCGWLDLVAVRHAIRFSGINALALTKLDVLDGIPRLKVAVAYRLGGRQIDTFPSRARHLAECQPVYEEMPGWQSLAGAGSLEEMPPEARAYVRRIEELTGVPAVILSLGSHRSRSLVRL
ncbi:MAG TPA: adenylosuccinate synthetase, partial [Candidatus Nitrosotenuis sp.]|nr:adenylosuccinate synthetase [Candidatus Nitrosotenuis sp.]